MRAGAMVKSDWRVRNTSFETATSSTSGSRLSGPVHDCGDTPTGRLLIPRPAHERACRSRMSGMFFEAANLELSLGLIGMYRHANAIVIVNWIT